MAPKGNKSKASRKTPSVTIRSQAEGRSLGGWVNPQSSTKELEVALTDFFDTTAALPYGQWLFSPLDPYFPPGTGSGGQASVGKVTQVDLYALPRFSVATAEASSLVLFGVPILSAGVKACASQASTLLTPTSVSDWVRVGGWKADTLLADSNVALQVNSTGGVCLASVSVVNPDDFAPSSTPVQFMIKTRVLYALPPVTQAPYSFTAGADPTGPVFDQVVAGLTPDSPILAQVLGVRNAV